MPEKQFQIHNTTRDPRTRITRAQSPLRARVKLFLAGGTIRVLRSRPLIVHESVVRRLLAELVEKEKAGHAKVTTLQGEHVDLSTLRPLEKAPAVPKRPVVKPDTAAADKGQGIPFVPHADPKAEPAGANVPLPKVGERAIPEGEVPRAPEPPAPPPPAEPPVPEVIQQVQADPEPEPHADTEPPPPPEESPPPEEPAEPEPPPPAPPVVEETPAPAEPSSPEPSRTGGRKKRKNRRK